MRFVILLVLMVGCESANPEAEGGDMCGAVPCCAPPSLDSMDCPAGSELVVGDRRTGCMDADGQFQGPVLNYSEGGEIRAYGVISSTQFSLSICSGQHQTMVLGVQDKSICVEECYLPTVKVDGMGCDSHPSCD